MRMGTHALSFPAGGVPTASAQPQRFYWQLEALGEYLSTGDVTIGIADQWSILLHWTPIFTDTNFRRFFHIYRSAGGNNDRIRVFQESGSGLLRFICYSSSGVVIKDCTIPGANITNVPSHLILTFDGSAGGDPLLAYLNGVPVAPTFTTDTTGTMTDSVRTLEICRPPGGLQYSVNLQDVAISNGVVSAADAAAIYAQVRDFDPFAGLNALHAHTPSDIDDMGKDYGISGSPLDLMAFSANVDSSDRFQGLLI